MKPFSIFYVTNGQESDPNTNPVQADVGNNGFCLTFIQFWNATNSCVFIILVIFFQPGINFQTGFQASVDACAQCFSPSRKMLIILE